MTKYRIDAAQQLALLVRDTDMMEVVITDGNAVVSAGTWRRLVELAELFRTLTD